MGKLKDIVTDVTFKLKAHGITQVKAGRGTKDVEFYEYAGDNGAIIKFCAHPTRAWNWLVLAGNVEGRLAASHLINAFTTAGLERGDKSFNEAIATLKI
jgi:hypothetical protein